MATLTRTLCTVILVLLLGGVGCIPATYTTLDGYNASIDYSCKTSDDCVIQDVHNCCGYYPKCVNKNTQTDPDFVREACADEGRVDECGFPSVDDCDCIQNTCVGT